MSPRELRPYQGEAVQAVINQWGNGVKSTAVVLPTGTGKSTVIAKLASISAAEMGLPVVMLAHRGELLDQMADTVPQVDPSLRRPGIVRAGVNEVDNLIVAASFQTLVNDVRHAALGPRRVILCDETHHASAETYRRVIEAFGPDSFFCGFTATLRREDGKALGDVIESIAFERNIRWAIKEGYLVKPTGITVKIPQLDLGKVKTTAGDFQNKELAEVMEAENPEVAKAILRHCGERRPIIFAASVAAAHELAAMLDNAGLTAEAVTGEMGYEDRQPIYDRFRSGATQALVTVQVLTEGADFPMCDAVVIARPTQSQNLYSQMVGRALRLWPGKADALVVDLVGTARVLKLVTISSLDAGVVPKVVDTEGEEVPPEDEDEVGELLGDAPAKARRLGPIDTISIDLLGADQTSVLWLQTVGGIPFVSPTDLNAAVFLWPAGYDDRETLYKVGVMPIKWNANPGGWLFEDKMYPASIAVGLVEDWIVDQAVAVPRRTASWRRNAPASKAQLSFARSLGIINPEDMTKARLSDEISIVLVSRKLDV